MDFSGFSDHFDDNYASCNMSYDTPSPTHLQPHNVNIFSKRRGSLAPLDTSTITSTPKKSCISCTPIISSRTFKTPNASKKRRSMPSLVSFVREKRRASFSSCSPQNEETLDVVDTSYEYWTHTANPNVRRLFETDLDDSGISLSFSSICKSPHNTWWELDDGSLAKYLYRVIVWLVELFLNC